MPIIYKNISTHVGPKDGFTLTDGLELGDGVGSLLMDGMSDGYAVLEEGANETEGSDDILGFIEGDLLGIIDILGFCDGSLDGDSEG